MTELTDLGVAAIRDGVAHDLAHCEPIEWEGVVGGFSAFRVSMATEDAIVGEVAAAGSDMILLDPPGLRAEVIARLREVIG